MKEMALIFKMDKYIKYSGTEVRKLTFAEIEKYHDERQFESVNYKQFM